jgi:hypothetical protein
MFWICSTQGRYERNIYKVLVGKTEGNWSFGTPRRRWNDIGTDLKDEGLEFWDTGSFSKQDSEPSGSTQGWNFLAKFVSWIVDELFWILIDLGYFNLYIGIN